MIGRGERRQEEDDGPESVPRPVPTASTSFRPGIEGRPTGCTANCAVQVTAQPAVLMVGIHKDNYTNRCIADCGHLPCPYWRRIPTPP